MAVLICGVFIQLEVLVLRANLEDCLENCVEFADARGLGRLLDQDLSESGDPLQEPVIVTPPQERLQEIGQSLEILLIVVVVGDVADDDMAFVGDSVLARLLPLLVWEESITVLTQGLLCLVIRLGQR